MDVVSGLTDDELDQLLDDVDWVEIPGGEALFRQEEASDSFYVVVRGRLRALLTDDTGEEVVIRELSRGDAVGELGVLTGAPRSATVVAVRDTELARFSTAAFERAIERSPRIALPLARIVANRMNDRRTGRAESGIGTVAFLPAGAQVDVDTFVDAMLAQLPVGTDTTVLRSATLPDDDRGVVGGRDRAGRASRRPRRARRHGTRRTVGRGVRAASRSSGARRRLNAMPTFDRRAFERCSSDSIAATSRPPRISCCCIRAGTARPSGTGAWLDLRPFVAHHHVRARERRRPRTGRPPLHRPHASTSRSAAEAPGRSRRSAPCERSSEAGIPIDRIAGSSMGGVMALQLAFGWTTEEMQQRNRKEWGAAAIQRKFTVPMVSLLSVRTARPMFDRMFGDAGRRGRVASVLRDHRRSARRAGWRRSAGGARLSGRERPRPRPASGRRSSIQMVTSSSTGECSTTCPSTRCGRGRRGR